MNLFNEVLASGIADEMLGINELDAPLYLQLQMKAIILEGIKRYCDGLHDTQRLLDDVGRSRINSGPIQ